MSLFLRKNHLLRCWGSLSLLNWTEALTLSLLLKLPPRKLEQGFILWSFFLVSLHSISINLPYNHEWNNMLSCPVCDVWVDASNCHFELSDKLQKLICRNVHSSLATTLAPLAHCQNVASLSLFLKSISGSTCSTSLFSRELYSLSNSDRLHDFSVTIFLDQNQKYMTILGGFLKAYNN